MVAVSKAKPISDIKLAYEAGQRIFGENYVDEFVEKAKEIVAQRVSDTFDEYDIKREARSVLFGKCAFVKFEEVA